MNLILLVLACNAVPLLAWWALSILGPLAIVWLCLIPLALVGFRALMRRNGRIFDHFKP